LLFRTAKIENNKKENYFEIPNRNSVRKINREFQLLFQNRNQHQNQLKQQLSLRRLSESTWKNLTQTNKHENSKTKRNNTKCLKHNFFKNIKDNKKLREIIKAKVVKYQKPSKITAKNKNLGDYFIEEKIFSKRYQ